LSELKVPEVNRVMLSGRLTHDPDRRYATDGTPVTRLSLAFHRRYRSRDGRWSEQTGFATVMTYRRLADACAHHLHKGNAVLVEGRLQMREWEGERGQRKQRLEIRADSVHFLEKSVGRTSSDAGSGKREGELL
jgi:single-strand DNA-binding protein